jgi:hypothetical protein
MRGNKSLPFALPSVSTRRKTPPDQLRLFSPAATPAGGSLQGGSVQRVGPDGVATRRMGGLCCVDELWSVFLECERDRDTGAARGRVHFRREPGGRAARTAWIFVEWTERDVELRFHEFGAEELWELLSAVTGG